VTTSYDVARQLVTQLGGNGSDKNIVRAVAIWLRFESGGTILGNNPWNMRPGNEKACTKGTDAKGFVVYCSLQDGITATAQRLSNGKHGYPAIKTAIRSGSPVHFFTALAASAWDGNHYVGSIANMRSAFASSATYNFTLKFADRAGPSSGGPGTTTTATTALPANLIPTGTLASYDPSHILTQADLDYLYETARNSYSGGNPILGLQFDTVGGGPAFKQALQAYLGKPISSLPRVFGGGALDSIAGLIAQVSEILGFLLDPENWLYGIATIAGVALSAYAVRQLVNTTAEGPRPQVMEQTSREIAAKGRSVVHPRGSPAKTIVKTVAK
jgi:hypothetical protein